MKPIVVNSSPLLSNSSTLAIPEWHDLISWNHCWDIADAVTYADDGTDWSIAPASRVAYVADRGLGTHPLRRDNGIWGGIFGDPPLSGPLLVTSSPRFNGRPAIVNDELGPGAFGSAWSMLSPNVDPTDSAGWFNAPSGIAVPYWVAALARPSNGNVPSTIWDAQGGSIGTTVSLFHDVFPAAPHRWATTNSVIGGDPWPATTVDQSDTKTVFVILRCDTSSSFMEINQRNSAGIISTVRTTFTLANHSAKEIFFGWISASTYFSAGGIKSGIPVEADLDKLRSWAAQYIPTDGFIA